MKPDIFIRRAVMLVVFALIFGVCHSAPSRAAESSNPHIQLVAVFDVPFVPTNEKTIEEMLRMCDVTATDVVYDLGCGDGRIAIMAAKQFGATAVGIDIDPQRIKESKANAAKAGVQDKVQFIQKDIFEADFSKATVVTLYLLSTINLKLRPKLFEQLRPGTRIVSHDFSMDDWEPDKVRRVGGDIIYQWVVPADAGGVWGWNDGKSGERYTLRISQRFQKVQGTWNGGNRTAPIQDAVLTGDALSFTVNRPDGDLRVQAKVAGDLLQGTIEPAGRQGNDKSSFRAKREAPEPRLLHASRR
jgi:SAM-dependent methyltransferase